MTAPISERAPFRAEAVRVRRRSRSGAVLLVLGIAACAALGAAASGDALGPVAWGLVLAQTMALFLLPAMRAEGSGERPAALHVDFRGVRVNGRLVLPRERILGVTVVREGSGHIVTFTARRARDTVSARFEREEQARAVLAALDIEASAASFEVLREPLRGRRGRWAAAAVTAGGALALLAVVVALIRASHEAMLLAWPPLLWVWLVARRGLRARAVVLIGEDAVRVDGRLVPLESVERVTPSPHGLDVRLRSGETLDLRPCGDVEAVALAKDAMGARLSAARRTVAGAAAGLKTHAAQLARGARSVRAWLADLDAASAESAATYRVATIPEAELWRIVESPAAEPSARAGAAFALRRRLDESGAERIRVVALASANPGVRATLGAVADREGDDALAARMGALD